MGQNSFFWIDGGDELLHGSPAWFLSYLRTDPLLAIRNLRGSRVNGRWLWKDTLRQVLGNRSSGRWMRRFANKLTATPPALNWPALEWGGLAGFSPWTSPEAVRQAQRLVRTMSRSVEPLSQVRGLHRDLTRLVARSGMLRHFAPAAARHGVRLHAPFYDDRVVEACLSMRPQERVSRWRYKPLLAAAMRGVVPASVVDRATKAEGSIVEHCGMQRNRNAILEYFADSRLAELGLLDRKTSQEAVARSAATSNGFTTHLFPAVACEMWLRRLYSPAGA